MKSIVVAWVLLLVAGGAAASDDPRTLFLPTATTLSRGELSFTAHELILPTATLGITNDLEVTLGGTWIPGGEIIGMAAGKVRFERNGRSSVAGFAGAFVDVPEPGRPGVPATFPVLGFVLSHGDLFDGRLDVNGVAFIGVPFVSGSVDAVVILAPTLIYDVAEWISIVGELWLRGIVPQPQAGMAFVAAARLRFWRMTADLGWLIDVGVVGPPLPVVDWPGVPVLSLGIRL